MNERQHIALTEAQIIAAEKGELQLETRDGRKVLYVNWFRDESRQHESNVLTINTDDGYSFSCYKTGSFFYKDCSKNDIFISEPATIEQPEPKPLYEVGEIIEALIVNTWKDCECIGSKNGYVSVWVDGRMMIATPGHHRKKQTEKTVTLDGKTMTVKEAFKYLTNL